MPLAAAAQEAGFRSPACAVRRARKPAPGLGAWRGSSNTEYQEHYRWHWLVVSPLTDERMDWIVVTRVTAAIWAWPFLMLAEHCARFRLHDTLCCQRCRREWKWPWS